MHGQAPRSRAPGLASNRRLRGLGALAGNGIRAGLGADCSAGLSRAIRHQLHARIDPCRTELECKHGLLTLRVGLGVDATAKALARQTLVEGMGVDADELERSDKLADVATGHRLRPLRLYRSVDRAFCSRQRRAPGELAANATVAGQADVEFVHADRIRAPVEPAREGEDRKAALVDRRRFLVEDTKRPCQHIAAIRRSGKLGLNRQRRSRQALDESRRVDFAGLELERTQRLISKGGDIEHSVRFKPIREGVGVNMRIEHGFRGGEARFQRPPLQLAIETAAGGKGEGGDAFNARLHAGATLGHAQAQFAQTMTAAVAVKGSTQIGEPEHFCGGALDHLLGGISAALRHACCLIGPGCDVGNHRRARGRIRKRCRPGFCGRWQQRLRSPGVEREAPHFELTDFERKRQLEAIGQHQRRGRLVGGALGEVDTGDGETFDEQARFEQRLGLP